jgi:RNA polymerase sigma factor (sigma-70 family)
MSPSVSVRLLQTQSDARLVAFARDGHERAFEAIVRRYRQPLLGYCRRLLLSEERAEDALQQALTQAWLALRAGTEVENVKAWLYRIVHNSALNALRVSGYDYCTLHESLSGADAPQADLERRIAVREALAGLAALPEMQREALLRTAVEGSSHRQAARELGLSETAVRGLVYRARAALRATAGAIVPPPLVSWALESGGSGGPVGERLAELGAGGSAGVVGLLMKSGAAAVTIGVLASGMAAVHVHPKHVDRHSTSRGAHRYARLETARLTLTGASSANVTTVADIRGASEAAKSPPTHRSTPKTKRFSRHGHRSPVPAGVAPAANPVGPHVRGGNHRRSTADDDGEGSTHDGPRHRGSNTPGEDANVKGGGGRHDDGRRGSDGDESVHGERDHGPSEGGTSGGAFGGGQDGGTHDEGRGEERPGDSAETSSTTTNTSPVGGQDPIPESGKGD